MKQARNIEIYFSELNGGFVFIMRKINTHQHIAYEIDMWLSFEREDNKKKINKRNIEKHKNNEQIHERKKTIKKPPTKTIKKTNQPHAPWECGRWTHAADVRVTLRGAEAQTTAQSNCSKKKK